MCLSTLHFLKMFLRPVRARKDLYEAVRQKYEMMITDYRRVPKHANSAKEPKWVRVKIEPPGIGPQVSVLVSIDQGSILGTCF